MPAAADDSKSRIAQLKRLQAWGTHTARIIEQDSFALKPES